MGEIVKFPPQPSKEEHLTEELNPIIRAIKPTRHPLPEPPGAA